MFLIIIVSTEYFGLAFFYAAAVCREIFYLNALTGKLLQLASQNLQDIFVWR